MFGKQEQKKVLQSNKETNKKFSYELEGLTLNMTLRIDIKKELVAMRQMLLKGVMDIDIELSLIKSE